MREPELTIGIPVYNGAATIRAALDSLLAQTFQNFVLMISDNNSNDRTEEICREYESRDPRIRYVRQPKGHLGPADNFRFVLFEATTPLFMWATGGWLVGDKFPRAHVKFFGLQSRLRLLSESRVVHHEAR